MNIYTIPRFGHYTGILVKTFRDLGLKVVSPPSVSTETNRYGILNSVEMMCWPYKVVLGTLIKTVEDNKNSNMKISDVIMYSSEGQCRYRHYGSLCNLAMDKLEHNVKLHVVRNGRIVRDIKEITGASYLKVWRAVVNAIKEIKKYEAEQEKKFKKDDINILLIGEIYTLLEGNVNFNLRKKLLELGAGTKVACTLSAFISEIVKCKPLKSKKAEKYINRDVGGHGFQNIVHVLENIDEVDGIIYVFPLTCMPESTVLPVIEHICRMNKKPILKVEIDDNSSELNILTRLEAFVETIKMRKGIKDNVFQSKVA